jgi:hypothetical protein
MQLAARLAAILLALTSITPVAQAATVLRDFTPIDGTGHDPGPAATLNREASFTYTRLPFLDDPFFNRSITPAAYATLISRT